MSFFEESEYPPFHTWAIAMAHISEIVYAPILSLAPFMYATESACPGGKIF
jgi:hypothetical protein